MFVLHQRLLFHSAFKSCRVIGGKVISFELIHRFIKGFISSKSLKSECEVITHQKTQEDEQKELITEFVLRVESLAHVTSDLAQQ